MASAASVMWRKGENFSQMRTVGEGLVVGASPGVGRRRDRGRGVAPEVTAGARLGVGLGVDVCPEVSGQRGSPVRCASGVDVDGKVERLEVADVLAGMQPIQFMATIATFCPAH